MFAKLLKHDCRAVFKYWWLGAVSSLVLSVIGGMCIRIVEAEYTSFRSLQTIAMLGLVLCCVALALFLVLGEILVIARFFRHFFTDEGYLTFTLPVKKRSLLNSKILMSLIFKLSGLAIFILDVFIMLLIGIPEELFRAEVWWDISLLLADITETLGIYSLIYSVLVVFSAFIFITAQTIFVYLCITLAASIASKHKVLTAIGIYYAATVVVSVLMQIMSIGGIYTILELIDSMSNSLAFPAIVFVLFGVSGIGVISSGALYLLEIYLLDRHLNLE